MQLTLTTPLSARTWILQSTTQTRTFMTLLHTSRDSPATTHSSLHIMSHCSVHRSELIPPEFAEALVRLAAHR